MTHLQPFGEKLLQSPTPWSLYRAYIGVVKIGVNKFRICQVNRTHICGPGAPSSFHICGSCQGPMQLLELRASRKAGHPRLRPSPAEPLVPVESHGAAETKKSQYDAGKRLPQVPGGKVCSFLVAKLGRAF